MSMRAPKREPRPVYEETHHVILGHWEPGRWWRVLDPQGGLYMETSNRVEAKDAARREGYELQRERVFIPAVHQWHEEPIEDAP